MGLVSRHKRDSKRSAVAIIPVASTLLLLVLFVGVLLSPIGFHFAKIIGVATNGPYDYPNSMWISESPEIVLCVGEKGRVDEATASVVIGGEKVPVTIVVQNGRPVYFYSSPTSYRIDERLLTGEVNSATKDKVVISVQDDHLFNGKYETITLKRVSTD